MADNLMADNAMKIEKIKAIRPQIIVTGTAEKPYFEILYYDTTDKNWHIGFSSYSLAIVIKLKEEFFEIVGELEDIQPTADVVEIELLKDWLWEIALNNAGGDFSIACQDIISRLDGLRNFAKERAVNYESSKTEKR